MKNVLWVIAGLALSLVFVFSTGILAFQRTGRLGGAVFDLNNELAAVITPGPAVLPLAGIAAIAAGVLFVLTVGVGQRARRTRFLLRGSFSVMTAALIVASLSVLAHGYTQSPRPRGTAPGLLGWLDHGGSNSVVHLVLLVVVAVMWLQRDRFRAAQSVAAGPSEPDQRAKKAARPTLGTGVAAGPSVSGADRSA
jgi:hypothetical protein